MQEEKGSTEDEVIGWHHRLDVCEFEQALAVDNGQGSLAVGNGQEAAVHGVTNSRTQLSN